MASGAAVASVLGFETPRSGDSTEATVIAQIIAGLPVEAVDRLSSAVAPDDRSFAFNFVARATLNRRRAEERGKLTANPSRSCSNPSLAGHGWRRSSAG